jgi:rod shape-determining protein MreC
MGNTNELLMPDIPQSADIRVGDVLVTSGMGGKFPAGFPVGVISSLKPDETRLFVVGRAKPAARLDQGLEVLLLDEVIPAPPMPANIPANSANAAATPAVSTTTPPASEAVKPVENPAVNTPTKPDSAGPAPATEPQTAPPAAPTENNGDIP